MGSRGCAGDENRIWLSVGHHFCFETHGENWNEANQLKLSRFKQVDFVKYAYPRYEHKGQLRDYQQFLLENTNSSYLFMMKKMKRN